MTTFKPTDKLSHNDGGGEKGGGDSTGAFHSQLRDISPHDQKASIALMTRGSEGASKGAENLLDPKTDNKFAVVDEKSKTTSTETLTAESKWTKPVVSTSATDTVGSARSVDTSTRVEEAATKGDRVALAVADKPAQASPVQPEVLDPLKKNA